MLSVSVLLLGMGAVPPWQMRKRGIPTVLWPDCFGFWDIARIFGLAGFFLAGAVIIIVAAEAASGDPHGRYVSQDADWRLSLAQLSPDAETGCGCIGLIWLLATGGLYASMNYPWWKAMLLGVPLALLVAVAIHALVVVCAWFVWRLAKFTSTGSFK